MTTFMMELAPTLDATVTCLKHVRAIRVRAGFGSHGSGGGHHDIP